MKKKKGKKKEVKVKTYSYGSIAKDTLFYQTGYHIEKSGITIVKRVLRKFNNAWAICVDTGLWFPQSPVHMVECFGNVQKKVTLI